MADESGCVTARTAKVRSVTTDADVLGRLPPALRSRCSSKKMLAVHGRPRQHLQPVERCYRSMRGIGLMKPQVSVHLDVAMAQTKMQRAIAGLGENVASEYIPLVV